MKVDYKLNEDLLDTIKEYQLYNAIRITPRPNDTYKLLGPFTYKDVTVPKNYITNGADIPRFLWVFWPPNRSNYLPAIIVHDYLCDKQEYKKADLYLKEMMSILNVSKFNIWIFYNGVRLYHKLRYKQ